MLLLAAFFFVEAERFDTKPNNLDTWEIEK